MGNYKYSTISIANWGVLHLAQTVYFHIYPPEITNYPTVGSYHVALTNKSS